MAEKGGDEKRFGTIGRLSVTPTGAMIFICSLCKPNDFFNVKEQFDAHLKHVHDAEGTAIDIPTGNPRS